MSVTRSVYDLTKRVYDTIREPLEVDEATKQFTLSVPEAQTTTVDSVQGWHNRPPAVLRCPGCDSQILQEDPIADVECSDCYRSFEEREFADFELLALVCPRCETQMESGIRHPNVFDIPEYATCNTCQFHWDIDHWF